MLDWYFSLKLTKVAICSFSSIAMRLERAV